MSRLEMWVGIECTLNRVEDRFVNQCEKNKHSTRAEDLEKFASLGVKTIRYPALWELAAPDVEGQYDWTWIDERFGHMQRMGLNPIAGLIHHGSGPRYTNLLDSEFPEKVARYARAFAERFPWVENYTPINEILTTGFFSCLYGHWYPHKKNDRDAVFAVFNQVKATILAMNEIRKVNPDAKLIQTEDMGRHQGTELLKYQVDFQNERRFLSFDMLCGRIDKKHPIAGWLLTSGLGEDQLEWLQNNSCKPDILGINHYLLSNRYLDHRLELFGEEFHGGNGIHRYADVGAVDTPFIKSPTPTEVLTDVWNRYKIPMVITEAHVSGHRESQLQWLKQVWTEAENLRERRVDIRAVTAWSLLGTYDWNRLCTVDLGFYESGVFDIRTHNEHPRETAIAKMVRSLATKGKFEHPVLDQPGWWKRTRNENARPILITGGHGTLAQAFARICKERNLSYVLTTRQNMDIADEKSVKNAISKFKPWAVINTAGYVRVDEAENDRERCFRENVFGPTNLAKVCAAQNISFVTFSSDLVFNGEADSPYHEDHEVVPLNVYGESKAQSEKEVLKVYPKSLIIRTSSFFGPWDEYNFVTQTLRQLAKKMPVSAAADIHVSPTYVPDLVNATLDLLIDGEFGIVHLTNQGSVSWAQFGKLAAIAAKDKFKESTEHLIQELPSEQISYSARRPKFSALTSQRVKLLPNLEDALQRYIRDLEVRF